MDFKTQLGLDPLTAEYAHEEGLLIDYVNLKLTSIGQPTFGDGEGSEVFGLGKSLLASYQEKSRLLADYLPPVDQRIQSFLMEYFSELDIGEIPHLPNDTLILDRHGIARTLSVPAKGDHFSSDAIDSYRIHQGVLHNPKSDRRTTKGVFHVAEGGIPIPNDKKAVPKIAAARLLKKAIERHRTSCSPCPTWPTSLRRRRLGSRSCSVRLWFRRSTDSPRRKRWSSVSSCRGIFVAISIS